MMYMDFETFERGVRTILAISEQSRKINELGKQIAEEFTYVESFDVYNYLCESLCWWSTVPDARDMLEEFIWTYDFGRKWTKRPKSSNQVKLSTIDDIYQYLKGTPNRV